MAHPSLCSALAFPHIPVCSRDGCCDEKEGPSQPGLRALMLSFHSLLACRFCPCPLPLRYSVSLRKEGVLALGVQAKCTVRWHLSVGPVLACADVSFPQTQQTLLESLSDPEPLVGCLGSPSPVWLLSYSSMLSLTRYVVVSLADLEFLLAVSCQVLHRKVAGGRGRDGRMSLQCVNPLPSQHSSTGQNPGSNCPTYTVGTGSLRDPLEWVCRWGSAHGQTDGHVPFSQSIPGRVRPVGLCSAHIASH